MPRTTLLEIQRQAETALSEVSEGSRTIDLQLDFVDGDTKELIARFGGKWDRDAREYIGDADDAIEVELFGEQIRPAHWLKWWFTNHAADSFTEDDVVTDCLFGGGRRSGKTRLGIPSAPAYALAFPGSVVWIVVPTESFYSEPMKVLAELLPRDCYVLHDASLTYFFANGSRIEIRTAHKALNLKQGRADFVVINEAQGVSNESYMTLSASLIDGGGLVLSAANPPDVGDPGAWVADVATGAQTGMMPNCRFFFFDPEKNPKINKATLRAQKRKMDKRTYDVQIRGKFLLPPDVVLYEWDRMENEQLVPQMGDITREFTKHFEGEASDEIIGVDVQTFPWIAGLRMKAFRNPREPDNIEAARLWAFDEVFLDQGDEINFARACIAKGVKPSRTLIVSDATARWQQQIRDESAQRDTFKGAGSWDMLRSEGFTRIVGPDRELNANPNVVERMRAANGRICNAEHERLVFVDPERCPLMTKSVLFWRTVKGKPSRYSRAAHGGDALTYVIWRFFPRRFEETTVEHTEIPKRLKGHSRTKGFQ